MLVSLLLKLKFLWGTGLKLWAWITRLGDVVKLSHVVIWSRSASDSSPLGSQNLWCCLQELLVQLLQLSNMSVIQMVCSGIFPTVNQILKLLWSGLSLFNNLIWTSEQEPVPAAARVHKSVLFRSGASLHSRRVDDVSLYWVKHPELPGSDYRSCWPTLQGSVRTLVFCHSWKRVSVWATGRPQSSSLCPTWTGPD